MHAARFAVIVDARVISILGGLKAGSLPTLSLSLSLSLSRFCFIDLGVARARVPLKLSPLILITFRVIAPRKESGTTTTATTEAKTERKRQLAVRRTRGIRVTISARMATRRAPVPREIKRGFLLERFSLAASPLGRFAN